MWLKVDVLALHPLDRVARVNSRRVRDSLSQLTGIGATVHEDSAPGAELTER